MEKISVRQVGETVVVVGVVLSLVFVGFELQASRVASRAAAYQELGIAVADVWMARAQDRELSDALGRFDADSTEISRSDLILVLSFTVANLRLFETVYLQVEQGLLEEEAMDALGWSGFAQSRLLRQTWPYVRRIVSPAFATYLEESGIVDSSGPLLPWPTIPEASTGVSGPQP